MSIISRRDAGIAEEKTSALSRLSREILVFIGSLIKKIKPQRPLRTQSFWRNDVYKYFFSVVSVVSVVKKISQFILVQSLIIIPFVGAGLARDFLPETETDRGHGPLL